MNPLMLQDYTANMALHIFLRSSLLEERCYVTTAKLCCWSINVVQVSHDDIVHDCHSSLK